MPTKIAQIRAADGEEIPSSSSASSASTVKSPPLGLDKQALEVNLVLPTQQARRSWPCD
jgi:hypothetical protein